MDEIFDSIKTYAKLIKSIIIIVVVIVCFLLVLFIVNKASNIHARGHVKINIESTLGKVLTIKELHSYEYIYQSWATKRATDYNLSDYNKYKVFSKYVTQDKKQIEKLDIDHAKCFSDYKKEMKHKLNEYMELSIEERQNFDLSYYLVLKNGIDEYLYKLAEERINASYSEDLEESTENLEEVTDASIIYDYYSNTLIPERLAILDICDSYEALCDLESFLKIANTRNALNYATQVKYYVRYNGTVRFGIKDFEKIKIEGKENKIIITLPPIEILSTNVELYSDGKNDNSIIVMNDKYTMADSWLNEANILAKKDLYSKVIHDKELIELAKDNLKNTIHALTKPLAKDTDGNDITIEIVFEDSVEA